LLLLLLLLFIFGCVLRKKDNIMVISKKENKSIKNIR